MDHLCLRVEPFAEVAPRTCHTHRWANAGKVALQITEVKSGSYLDKDDSAVPRHVWVEVT